MCANGAQQGSRDQADGARVYRCHTVRVDLAEIRDRERSCWDTQDEDESCPLLMLLSAMEILIYFCLVQLCGSDKV